MFDNEILLIKIKGDGSSMKFEKEITVEVDATLNEIKLILKNKGFTLVIMSLYNFFIQYFLIN